MMHLEWQKNGNGTHYAEMSGHRYSIAWSALGGYVLKRDGVYHGTYPKVEKAKGVASVCAAEDAHVTETEKE